jgi:hypothetical protein
VVAKDGWLPRAMMKLAANRRFLLDALRLQLRRAHRAAKPER